MLFAGTLGIGIDRFLAKYGRLSPARALWFQAIGAAGIEALCDAFCEELPQLLAKEPVYRKDVHSEDEHHTYPVLDLDGISLHMNHAYRKEDALAAWNRRRVRVNPGNILAVMITDSVSEARRFEELPYEKKVCFVPFET
ncbi:MAG: DUF1919 domain-containing protein, partial [Firmicutes bacterium]|nr:DUF1919 domain-containing protein [Bacillota bacterium]